MTVAPQATAPPRPRTVPVTPGRSRTVPDAQAAPPAPPAAPSRRRQVALTPMRQETAKRIRKLAASVQESHPDMSVHDHLRDAAKTLESGNEEASQRHLRAAMFALTPQSLMRNGLHTDDYHQAARGAMHSVHRHLLLVKDITDAAAKNQAALRRDSYGDDSSSPPMPLPPVHADPNAGYGPGALAQKPTARQPPGDRALNAPNRAGTGKPDLNVADPVGPQPRGSKQFTTRNEVRAVTELAYGWGDVCAVLEMPAAGTAVELARPWLPSKEYWAGVDKGGGKAPKDRGGSDEEKADNHIADARKASASGMHQAAASHLARASALTSDPAKQARINTVGKGAAGLAVNAGQGSAFKLAVPSRRGLELSAETGRLAVTPAPYGKPGGPGLYGVAGMKHSDYFEQVVKALIARGKDKGTASKIAYGALRKWSRGGGGVHPEVRAAAAGALAEEAAKGAAAKSAHGHANSWDDVADRVLDLAAPPPANPNQPRVPAGQAGGGQFGSAGSRPQQQGGKTVAGKTASASAKATTAKKAQSKQGLLKQAAGYRAQADALIKQRDALRAELASASGKTSSGQSGSTTSSGASTTKSTAPAAASTAPAATSASAATPSSTSAASSSAASGSSTSLTSAQKAQITAQIGQMNAQIVGLQQQYAQAMAQAAKL